ncbi:DUF1214 domain-containing protein [Pseudomonas sp. TH10]|uniref:DUF1214 domain-containing protein n=1 Tax=Pseudomonas sp. TH10 TaxID=2796376 RepID=UPI00191210EE|nr:DUF1214 domain-containing protein [Pseudomonas sp. TH10]MBK5517256.1 DUF1214 domain-containing protein [Pseudomonas sp. TH10]
MKKVWLSLLVLWGFLNACQSVAGEMSDDELNNIVLRSYQYVAMYNSINNVAMQDRNPFGTHGWNKVFVPAGLQNHEVTAVPRPNNDTLYLTSTLDLRDDAIVIRFPAFDSKYVSLETSAYDHFVEMPLSTTKGDFRKATTLLFYSDRTKNYHGEPVRGVDRILKMNGDFAVAFLRIAPHSTDKVRMERILAQMKTQQLMTLSDFQGTAARPVTPVEFPAFSNDQSVFKNNFLEVMQFVFNHTSFDPDFEMDQKVLSAFKPLGVEPGKAFDTTKVVHIDGERLATVAAKVLAESLSIWNDPKGNPYLAGLFVPKKNMALKPMVLQSAVGPLGMPADQAQYPGIGTVDGQPILASGHYLVRMTKDQLPPARAFWSVTVYDSKHGLFIPNEFYKYSVGENGGVKLNAQGGVDIHIAPTRPDGVVAENWLPSGGGDTQLDLIMRIYAPDVGIMKTWHAPKAVKLELQGVVKE